MRWSQVKWKEVYLVAFLEKNNICFPNSLKLHNFARPLIEGESPTVRENELENLGNEYDTVFW